MAKSLERIQARKLRDEGESIKVIARKLKVSPSTVSIWCKDIKLKHSQIQKLERRARDPNYGRRLEYSLKQQQKRIEKTKKLLKEGKKEVGKLSKSELFIIGIALYWAEGFKKESQAGFASSDPQMIRFFIKWLKVCCKYKTSDLNIRVTINISHKYRLKEIEKFWSTFTKIPLDQFRKPYFQKVKWKKVYENPNSYFGVLRIKVNKSTDFLRKIHGWIEGLKNNSI